MVGVGGFRALAVGEQHEAVGDDVGQRVHGVGDQALRVGGEADQQLHGGQDDIDRDADLGDALAVPEARAFFRRRAGSLGVGHRVGVGFA
jgi:hypothetical protein